MKSMGMQIKPKREYFCYAGHRIQSALREVWGLKGVMKILVPVSERERARALTLVDPPWPSQSRVHIPGCSVHKRLLPWNHGVRNRSSRLQPELVLAHICYGTPDSILTLFLSSSYTQWGCYRRLLPWKHLVLRS